MEKIQPNITLLLPLTSPVARPPVVVLTGALDLLAPGIDLTSDFDVQMSPLLEGSKNRSCKGVGLMGEKLHNVGLICVYMYACTIRD